MTDAPDLTLKQESPKSPQEKILHQLCMFPPEILEAALRVLRLRRDSEASD